MSDYTRRPFLSSQTDKVILSQPEIFGTVHVNLDGEYDDMPASGTVELAIQTESTTSPTIETQQWDAAADDVSLAGIVEAINDSGSPLYPYVEASAFEGVLRLASKQSGFISAGNPSFLTIHPQTSGALVTDLGPIVGFALAPHPAATVKAGDLPAASVRAMTQGNRPGSAFIARGEDRTGENFNRALHALSLNLDTHQAKLIRDVAVPVVLEIPEGSARYRTDVATDRILGVELTTSYGDDLDAVLAAGIYIGGPAFDASVDEIAKFYSVLDQDWNEISVVSHDDPGPGDVKDTVVRIGTVAYVPSSPPGVYSDSDFELDGTSRAALSNNATFDSYRSVLADPSNQPVKSTSVITSVVDGATVVCSTATFVTDLVEEGDIAIISSSAVSSPINHDGSYIVDVVVSETELVLRPVDEDSVHLLNNDGLGNIEIRPNGQFETSLYLAFEPPLPRVPSGGIKIVLGMEDGFGDLPRDFMLVPAVNSAEEVDGWVLKNLFRAFNLQGVYDGQGQDKGSGFHADMTHRPLTMHISPEANAPSSVRTGSSGTIQDGSNWFTAGVGDEFTLADVGRSFTFTLAGTEHHDWRVAQLIDARTVKLVPPPHSIGTILATGAVSAWELFDTMLPDFQAAVSSISESAQAGGFHHTKVNDGTSSADLSFAHFEHVTDSALISTGSAISTLGEMTATLTGDELTSVLDSASVPVDLDDLHGLYPVSHGSTSKRAANFHAGKTFVKVTTSTEAGIYELYELRPNTAVLRNLDGTTPAVSPATAVGLAFYTLRMGVGVPVFGASAGGRAGLSVFQDSGPLGDLAIGIRAGWAGTGAGVLITANEGKFTGLYSGAAPYVSVGPAIQVNAYAPAYGALIAVEGDPTSVGVEGRGEFGIKIAADTSAHDLSMSDSGRAALGHVKGAGVFVAQTDKDPAAVFHRNQDTSWAGDPSPSTDLYPATVVIEDWRQDHRGAGRAGSVSGDLYGSDDTGLYFGSAMTANAAYARVLEDNNETSKLGSAELDEEFTGDVLAADFSTFNLPHDIIVSGAFTESPENLVGLRIRAGTGSPLFEGLIVAAIATKVAVRRTDSSGSVAPQFSEKVSVIGNGWWQAYLNLADFMLIGTGMTASARGNADLGLLYAGQRLFDRNDHSLDPTETQRTAERLSPIQPWSDPMSERVGQVAPSEAVSDVDGETYGTYASAVSWSTGPSGPRGLFYYVTPWESETGGGAPIAHHLLVHTPDGEESSFAAVDQPPALVSDFQLLSGDVFTESSRWGGGVQAGMLSGTGTVAVFKRLQSSRFPQVSLKLVCRLVVTGSDPDVTFALRNLSRGDAVATSELDSYIHTLTTGYNTGELEKVEIDLSRYAEELRAQVSDYLTQDDAIDTHILGIEVRVPSCSQVTIVEIALEENQLPEVHVGPQMVQGTHQAASYRYTDARRGFDSISPSRAHFLSGVDFGRAGNMPEPGGLGVWGDSDFGSDHFHAPHEGHNLSWAYVRDDFSVVVPTFDSSRVFHRGVSSLSVYGRYTAFDPAALVLSWQDDGSASGDLTDNVGRARFPGMTGFVGDIEAPHGSLLTSLSVQVSARPTISVDSEYGAQDEYGWGVYHSLGAGVPPVSGGTVDFGNLLTASETAWEEAAGVRISVWRHRHTNSLAAGIHTDSKLVETNPAGFSEKIAIFNLDFPDVDPSDFLVSPAHAAWGDPYTRSYGMKEEYFRANLDLTSIAPNLALLKVDRRRYSYSFSVEFYTGIRQYSGGDIIACPTTNVRPMTTFWFSTAVGQATYPPVVKFRGAQVGYLTDRPAHGGW